MGRSYGGKGEEGLIKKGERDLSDDFMHIGWS